MVGLNERDKLSNHAPLHFDLSIFDVFAGVKVGATVVLVPARVTLLPYRLAEWIDAQDVSVLDGETV